MTKRLSLATLLASVAVLGATRHGVRSRPERDPKSEQRAGHHLGDGRRRSRPVHAGRVPVPRDRLLAAEERRRRRGEDPRQPRDRDDRLVGGRLRHRLAVRQQVLRHRRVLLPFKARTSPASSVGGTDTALMLFGMLFCAVSLAIVWGTTLERIKFSAYVIYAAVFGGDHLPAGGARRLRRRTAVRRRRQAGDGLRRIVGRPPDRCGRRTRGAAAARRAQGQVRRRRHAAGDPGSLDADRRPRRADPLGRLVRVQRRLDVRHRPTTSSPRSR